MFHCNEIYEMSNPALSKNVRDSTDSDNEEKEDGELEEGEVEEDETDQSDVKTEEVKCEENRDDAKENKPESAQPQNDEQQVHQFADTGATTNRNSMPGYRRRDHHHHHSHRGHHHNVQTNERQYSKDRDVREKNRNSKHETASTSYDPKKRRKRRHSEERDDRNKKRPRGKFRGGGFVDVDKDIEEAEDDEMMGAVWPPKSNRSGQQQRRSTSPSQRNNGEQIQEQNQKESNVYNDQQSNEEQSSNILTNGHDEQNEELTMDEGEDEEYDEEGRADDDNEIGHNENQDQSEVSHDQQDGNRNKKLPRDDSEVQKPKMSYRERDRDRDRNERHNRGSDRKPRKMRPGDFSKDNSKNSIENRGRRYYENRRERPWGQDRDRNASTNNSNTASSGTTTNVSGNNNNTNTGGNQRYRNETSLSTPICKFYMENRCMKGSECLFSHDYKPPKKTDLCKYYVQSYCQKNDMCPFLHSEFPCKFFHTGTKDCTQGDRCKFSHDPIINEDIRFAFEKYLNEQDEQSINNGKQRSSTFDSPPRQMNASSKDQMINTEKLTSQQQFPIPALMELYVKEPSNGNSTSGADTAQNSSSTQQQSSSPAQTNNLMQQRTGLFYDTLNTTTEQDDSSNNSTSTANTSTSNDVSRLNNPSTTTTTANSNTCPLPIPLQLLTMPSGLPPPPQHLLNPIFPRLSRPSLNNNSLPPPLHPGLFSAGARVPFLFPGSSRMPITPPNLDFLNTAAAAAAAAFTAVAANTKFNSNSSVSSTPGQTSSSFSTSPQLGKDIDERISSHTTIKDIDERGSSLTTTSPTILPQLPSSTTSLSTVLPPPPLPLGLLSLPPNQQTSVTSTTVNPSVDSSFITDDREEEHKSKSFQDIFKTPGSLMTDNSFNVQGTVTTAAPSFDFISMLQKLKQNRLNPNDSTILPGNQDLLEIHGTINGRFNYVVRPIIINLQPYALPEPLKNNDPRGPKYQEKFVQWQRDNDERIRMEKLKTYSLMQQQTSISSMTPNNISTFKSTNTNAAVSNSSLHSRDPRLLRNAPKSNNMKEQSHSQQFSPQSYQPSYQHPMNAHFLPLPSPYPLSSTSHTGFSSDQRRQMNDST
ncbi:unnamed protein product [Didymodactylos carnosus]|uniref:C3H1-type domain-containing protein n=1 Tax=Didymodactylos carnosus TaxID=1234261 RepID=A0A813YGV5_9BILA|nr:unnamed protein product [Didymodactylos carnosus]CAF0978896.1 unnamed protein product [Didymodactylos carnosus]CAF3669580.1 unnamed protein product [Didymodactylos carnosus]CAF3749543.1 unnamed protein product [Didymodactylos carnosus]